MYYIIRHGQTVKNKAKALQGQSNSPLNETGREQAKALAAYFAGEGIKFDLVYSSPLTRAIETAKIVAGEDLELLIDDRIIEIDYGKFEGASLDNLPEEIKTFFKDFVNNPAPEGMESLPEVTARMGEFLEEVAGYEDKNVLISVHAICMKGALEYLTPESQGSYWSKYVANCALYAFDYDKNGYGIPFEIEY